MKHQEQKRQMITDRTLEGQVTALPLEQRMAEPDVLRGIALLGILVSNIAYFSGTAEMHWPAAQDQAAVVLSGILTGYSFNTMFSFLFGFGFILFWQKIQKQHQNPLPFYARRMGALCLFGLVHGILIWFGDILFYYSLMGIVLLLFRNCKPKTLLKWAFGILTVPVLLLLGSIVLGPEYFASSSEPALTPEELSVWIEVYQKGTIPELLHLNWLGVIPGFLGYLWMSWILFPMFLLGAYACKKEIFSHLHDWCPKLRKIQKISLGAAIAALIPLFFETQLGYQPPGSFLETMSLMVSGVGLCLFYMTTIISVMRRSWGKKILSVFRAPGYLSLTNYLMQSVVGCLIFNNYGLGLYGTMGPARCVLLVIVIFGIQLVISNLWMKQFRHGPMEWIWRKVTYFTVRK